MLLLLKILFAFVMLTAVFLCGLFVWELMCKLNPEMHDFSILFNKDEW